MKKALLFFLISIICYFGYTQQVTLTKQQLLDKIKGGWAGQTIGVTFGGPYEWQYNGTFIGDYQSLLWYDGYLKKSILENPGLYDDLYMDLTFVDVFEKYGFDAPVDSFANAVAYAAYPLWHANQVARYNILNGLKAPQSGYWKNNPHADCIDYQIESDFAGLMSPGMPNTASAISDKIGHIMNYGDGWYGGVYIGAMYSLSFISADIEHIVSEALKSIPKSSEFYKCINDVIGWYKKYPEDWKKTWFEMQKKWADDVGCSECVFSACNIDAKVNAAYVVIGLLYGKGDFTQTLEITTRIGQDADCNASSAAGILGTIFGYDKIPAYWKQGLKEAEEIKFKYTTMSLNDVYKVGFKHALDNIQLHGGSLQGDNVIIRTQVLVAVKFEKSFDSVYPISKIPVQWTPDKDEFSFNFEGTGFVIIGNASFRWESKNPYIFKAELYIDGKLAEIANLPVKYITRRFDLFWNYDLPKGPHAIMVKITNPNKDEEIRFVKALIYSDRLGNGIKANQRTVLK